MTQISHEDLEKRDQEIRNTFWALLFLISEQNLAFSVMAAKLAEKGIFEEEDQKTMNTYLQDGKNMQEAYQKTEAAFKQRLERITFAIEHPEEVTEKVNASSTATS